jgi:DNA polymerase delta subunit 1
MKMLDIVLREQNVPKAFEYVKGVLSNLLRGKIEVSKLIITKGLSKTAEEYKKGGTKQQHVELAKRIEERCDVTGETPYQTGDRVPFIMVAGTKNSMACELAEDPVYAQKNGIPINTHFYVHKQIWPATIRIAEAILNPEMCKKIKSSMPMHEREKLEGHKRLFVDTLPHMRVRKQARLQVGSQHGISKMAQVEKGRCLGCNVLCEDAVCEDCDPWILKRRAQEWHHSAKKKQETAWNRCLKCMGASSKKDVIVCTNKTCENLYRRQQCDIDVEDLGNDLQRLYEGDPPVM